MTKDGKLEIRKPQKDLSQTQQQVALDKLDDYPFKSVAMASTRSNLTGMWRYWRPYYLTKRAPCDANCPVGNQVVDYIQALHADDPRQAATILRAENPLPAITGRVCHRPCEGNCNRAQYDERIGIHTVETVLAEVQNDELPFPSAKRGRTVAVVGSGPAELSFAHFMASLHHQVTIFETGAALGGLLREGALARRLEGGILDAAIERVVSDRIAVSHGDVTSEELEQEYDVVFGNAETRALRRVSEAVGYGKRAALLLDAEWRGLNPSETLARIQVGESSQIVSAMKYVALLADQEIKRSEKVVTFEELDLEFLEPSSPVEPSHIDHVQSLVKTGFVSRDNIDHVVHEAARCFSCGRCNSCDNCWIYCPDACISRDEGVYQIDYDYCKGCTLCAAVCPRNVISIIEEEKWNE
jgi:2-oxoacid:acceptor oxidoreductase delta subunit (pyruvate/2-ketoisovalerate family)